MDRKKFEAKVIGDTLVRDRHKKYLKDGDTLLVEQYTDDIGFNDILYIHSVNGNSVKTHTRNKLSFLTINKHNVK